MFTQPLGVVFAIVAWFLALFSIWTALRRQLHHCLAVFRMVEMSEQWFAGWRVLPQETHRHRFADFPEEFKVYELTAWEILQVLAEM